MIETFTITAYRLAGGRDRWGRCWQAEIDDPEFGWASRAWTRRGVLRRTKRRYFRGWDAGKHRRKYHALAHLDDVERGEGK